MYKPAYVRVTAPGQRHEHILRLAMFQDGEGKALCGVKPFPDKWEISNHSEIPAVCAGCKVKIT